MSEAIREVPRTLPAPAPTLADVLSEVKRLHERMDKWEASFSATLAAAKSNPMLATLLRANGVQL